MYECLNTHTNTPALRGSTATNYKYICECIRICRQTACKDEIDINTLNEQINKGQMLGSVELLQECKQLHSFHISAKRKHSHIFGSHLKVSICQHVVALFTTVYCV